MSDLDTVHEIYEAFGRGEIDAILGRLADDVSWDRFRFGNSAQDAGIAYLQERHGRDAIAGFFAALAENLEFQRFEPQLMLEGDGHVVAVIDEEMTNTATGKRFADRAVHIWSFDPEGRVISLEHTLDSAKHIEAARG